VANVELLRTRGPLRKPSGRLTLGQIDGGAVAAGIALLVSKKTRGLPDNVVDLSETISRINTYRVKPTWDILKEFQGRKLYGECWYILVQMLLSDAAIGVV
jgi:hypothetical protein